jgi:hypothetical protein
VLHVLNGDATATVFADASLPGEVLVWRDILVEGPVTTGASPTLVERAAYLADRLGLDAASYVREVEGQRARLAAAVGHDEVVLWFEQDLFCAVTLWSLLAGFAHQPPAARLSLVYPAPDDEARGLGSMPPARLAALFAAREPVTDQTLTSGARAWAAYAATDPLACGVLAEREPPALSFVGGALRCHLGRFPSIANGLNEVEGTALSVLQGGRRGFGALFRQVSAHPRMRRHGMGDLQLAACLRGLGPLVSAEGSDMMQAELDITSLGRQVVAGAIDWLDIHPIDTWLGGAHLRRGDPLWRWDSAGERLVPWRA